MGVTDIQKAVDKLSKALLSGTTDFQYLAFENVSEEDLAAIDLARADIGRHTRMAYYADSDRLIVKLMPSAKHQAAHHLFSQDFMHKIWAMGVPRKELYPLGGTRFRGPHSSKEADAAYKPLPIRSGEQDWPTIVFECGLSKSLARLRIDAQWWLTESGGHVNTAVLISTQPLLLELHIEKWELGLAQGPTTRASSSNVQQPPQVPICVQTIHIDQVTVTGAPLVLDFGKIFLRPPVPPESNLVFSTQDLAAWAEGFWEGVK